MDQVAVVLPGAGSSADFVRRAFLRPLREAGYLLVAPPPVPGPDLVRAAFRSLDAAAAEYGPRLRLVGGVSLGAHTAARWTAARAVSTAPGSAPSPAGGVAGSPAGRVAGSPAGGAAGPPAAATAGSPAAATAGSPAGGVAGSPAGRVAGSPAAAAAGSSAGGVAGLPAGGVAGLPAGRVAGSPAGRVALDGVVLVLPAWTGAPGAVAAATAASADLVERLGTDGALAAAGTAVGWVAAELAAAWPVYGDGLAASLRAAAAAPGPTPAELAALPVPAGLVAFPDDPLHPAAVAHDWAAAIPRAAVRELPLAAPAPDRSVLGATALAALAAARRT